MCVCVCARTAFSRNAMEKSLENVYSWLFETSQTFRGTGVSGRVQEMFFSDS